MQDNRRDDLDIEIVDIDGETPYEKSMSHRLFSTRLLPKKRPIQAIITISIVILVLLSIVESNPDIRNKLLAMTTLPVLTLTTKIQV